MNACPTCSGALFTLSKDETKLKATTSVILLHKSGEVEINCPHCKCGVILPLAPIPGQTTLKKGRQHQRLVLRRGA